MKTPQEEIQQLLDKGHTQDEIAKAAKVSQMTISRWVRGETKKISYMVMMRIKAKFDNKKGQNK